MPTEMATAKHPIGPHEAYTKDTVLYVRFDGDFTYEQAKGLLSFVEQRYGTTPYYAICDISHQGHTSPEARRLLTEWTQNKQLRAAAMIGGSLIARTMATLIASTIRIFSKKSIPMIFVLTMAEAEAWIERQRHGHHK